MNNAPDSNSDGPGRLRLFWVAGLTAMVALGLAPWSFHVERRLDTAVRLEGSESDYVAKAVAVLIDATLVRMVIGPALLTLAGDWTWCPWGLAGANATAARERIW